jgi:murein L,D-transpeptidase YcbB/YkuD
MGVVRTALALLCSTAAAAALADSAGAQQIPPQAVQPREAGRIAWASGEQVRSLQHAILTYRALAGGGGWPKLPDGVTLRAGDTGANVDILRRRLVATGDAGPAAGPPVLDAALLAGVRRFQLRHGLPPTGVVHDLTRRALNVPADVRSAQLQLNLDRVLELMPKLTTRRVFVMNAASFELQGIEDGRVAVASRTIVGKRATPTPAMSARVESITLLPYWHVPGGIARRTVVPAIRKDPAYLYRERIRVFSNYGGEEIDPAQVNWWGPEAERYLFRQDPGPHNALGVIRFDMPNKYVVYLHDTTTKDLYAQFERTYSSGCVRTQGYLDAAEWAFAGQAGWTRAAIESGIAAGRSKTIKLAEPIPVHLIYLTAWVEDGAVQFRNDVYGRDKTLVDRGQDVAQRAWITTVGP